MSNRARFLAGAVFAGLVIVVIVLITTSGSDQPAARLPPPARLPKLVQLFQSTAIGVTGAAPRDWSALRGPDFVLVHDRNQQAQVLVKAVVTQATPKALLSLAVETARKTYHQIAVKRARGTVLGGLPARSYVLYTRGARGRRIRILVAAAHGRNLGYVLEALTFVSAPLKASIETQQIVLTLHLTG